MEPRQRPSPPADRTEERSLDLVQRMIISALIVVVFGLFAAVLAAYIAFYPEESSRSSTIGLWAMSGIFGLATAAAVLVVNRRRPYSPWVVLGLLPMAVAAFWVF
jgi:type IV secretory pathway protease TraF